MSAARHGRGLLSVTSAALAACVLWSCGPQYHAQREVRGDTTLVWTALPERRDTAQLLVTARLQLAANPDTALRTSVTALAVDGAGNIVTATDDGLIRRYDARGVLAATLPLGTDNTSDGEPLVMRALLVRPNGEIVARDQNGDIHRVLPGGSSQRTAAHRTGQLLAAGPNGTLLVGLERPADFDRDSGLPLLARLDDAGLFRDTVYLPEHGRACAQPADAEHFRSGTFADLRMRYLPAPQWAVLSTGALVSGCNARYEIDIQGAQGAVTRVRHAHTPVPVSAEERESFVSAWTLRMRNAAGAPSWSWQGAPLPDQKPAYQRILVSSDDRIWVWPAQPSARVPAPPQWILLGGPRELFIEPGSGAFDVFAADGSFLGSVALGAEIGYAPFGTRPPPVIRGDTLWFVAADSAGAHEVVRAQVSWPRARPLRLWPRMLRAD